MSSGTNSSEKTLIVLLIVVQLITLFSVPAQGEFFGRNKAKTGGAKPQPVNEPVEEPQPAAGKRIPPKFELRKPLAAAKAEEFAGPAEEPAPRATKPSAAAKAMPESTEVEVPEKLKGYLNRTASRLDTRRHSEGSAPDREARGGFGKPIIRQPNKDKDKGDDSSRTGRFVKNKLLNGDYWKEKGKVVMKKTEDLVLKPVAETLTNLPAYMEKAYDSVSATLKLDARGRLLALIQEAEDDISFVRREFSSFSITWAPIMEKSLSYIGMKNLNSINLKTKDELDFRADALNAAVFGYEFMRLMMVWRENLMFGHRAFKDYLESVRAEFDREKFEIDNDYMLQLNLIHNYILSKCWMEIDNATIKNKLKLDFLMDANDAKVKNYESTPFRQIIILQELYEPTRDEFREERRQVFEALKDADGNESSSNFDDIDDYVADFTKSLAATEDHGQDIIDWQVPTELEQFMEDLKPELENNQRVYSISFLKDLKQV